MQCEAKYKDMFNRREVYLKTEEDLESGVFLEKKYLGNGRDMPYAVTGIDTYEILRQGRRE